jgi:hypothetical protein
LIFYWAPEWISVPSLGSPWENVTLFNFSGELLSSISVFDSTTSSVQIQNGESYSFRLYQNYPNPFNSHTVIKYEIPNESYVTVKLFIYRTKWILVDEFKTAVVIKAGEAEYLVRGIYFLSSRRFNDRER